jgi:hypothetical protein
MLTESCACLVAQVCFAYRRIQVVAAAAAAAAAVVCCAGACIMSVASFEVIQESVSVLITALQTGGDGCNACYAVTVCCCCLQHIPVSRSHSK